MTTTLHDATSGMKCTCETLRKGIHDIDPINTAFQWIPCYIV